MRERTDVVTSTLAAFLVSSCTVGDGTAPQAQSPSLGIDQFPMVAGHEWTYSVYDSLLNTRDTVTVRAIANAPDVPSRALWVYKGRNYTDTTYVAVSGDSVLLYDSPDAKSPSTVFLFPLVDGTSWGAQNDRTDVRVETDVPSYIGTLAQAFSVARWARDGFNSTLESHVLVASGVGIVRWEKKETNLGPVVHQTWDLIRYKREG